MTKEQMEALLAFFRNLTPQALFFACTVYFAVQLDFGRFAFDYASLKLSVSFVFCFALWLLSFAVNFVRFSDAFLSGGEKVKRALTKLQRRNFPLRHRLWLVFVAAWRLNKKGFFEFLLVIVVIYASMMPILTVAIQSATGFMETQYKLRPSASPVANQTP